jgi:hypothetical protein
MNTPPPPRQSITSSIYNIFQRPFPLETDSAKRVMVSALFGVCVAAILLALQPFGLSRYQGDWKTLIICFYGVITFLCMMSNYFVLEKIFSKYFEEESWTVGKHIIFLLIHILTIATVNFLYSCFVFSFDFHWLSLLNFIGWTFSIGLFPTVIQTLILERRYWKQNVAEAAKITSDIEELRKEITKKKPQSIPTPKLITLIGSSAKEQYELNPVSILCVQANDNYVTLFYESSETVKKVLFRATLKALEEQLSQQSNFYRCHKSYIVNVNNVFKVSGNAQGYKLHLSDLEFVVPVSRSLQTEMLEKLQHVERD